jgi:hypothetical protein
VKAGAGGAHGMPCARKKACGPDRAWSGAGLRPRASCHAPGLCYAVTHLFAALPACWLGAVRPW